MATQQGSPDADTDKVAAGEWSIKFYVLRVVRSEQVFSAERESERAEQGPRAEGNKADETKLGLRKHS